MMILYHVTTPKKVKKYKDTGAILPPVRGFDSVSAALFWAGKTGRKIVLKIETGETHKLPDHHNKYGCAWWTPDKILEWTAEAHMGDDQC